MEHVKNKYHQIVQFPMERCPVLHPATAQVTEWISGERLELTAARDLDEALGLGLSR